MKVMKNNRYSKLTDVRKYLFVYQTNVQNIKRKNI